MTKLGPHCLTPTSTARVMVAAGSPVALFVDDFGAASEFLGLNPNIILIGRRNSVYPNDPSRVVTAESLRQAHDPISAAALWFSIQQSTYSANPLIKYWTGPNEPVWGDLAGMTWYGQFEAERARLLHTVGLKAVVGNFSTGTPDITGTDPAKWWSAFKPAIDAIKLYGGFVGVHEYSDGPMLKDVDATGRGWNTLRFVRVWDLMGEFPTVITECGRLDFKKFTSPETYAQELIQYDTELLKHPNLYGAVIFTFGSNNSAWDSYNVDGTPVVNILADYASHQSPPPVIIPPTPTPTEVQMPIAIADLNYSNFYTWDALAGAPEPGNTIFIPNGMNFDYVHDTAVRVTWTDIKTTSPTYGKPRTNDNPFLKPEVVIKTQAVVPDIALPLGLPVIKSFKGYSPIWVAFSLGLKLDVGSKVKVTWPVFPNLMVSDNNGVKVYSDDPGAGWIKLTVKDGDVPYKINASGTVPLDSTWYNGRDFPFGSWFAPQIVVDVTSPVMTVTLQGVSIFGLKDSDFILAKPTVEIIQPSGGNNGGNPVPPSGTLLGNVSAVSNAAEALVEGVNTVKAASDALKALIGAQ